MLFRFVSLSPLILSNYQLKRDFVLNTKAFWYWYTDIPRLSHNDFLCRTVSAGSSEKDLFLVFPWCSQHFSWFFCFVFIFPYRKTGVFLLFDVDRRTLQYQCPVLRSYTVFFIRYSSFIHIFAYSYNIKLGCSLFENFWLDSFDLGKISSFWFFDDITYRILL